MAMDETTVYNLALSSLGTTSSIETPSEEGREAEACRLWYDYVRDLVFCSAPWPRLTGLARLAVSAERDQDVDWVTADPAPRWQFAYLLPSDYLRPRFLSTYLSFEESMIGDTPVLISNQENAILEYTRRVTNPGLWGIELYQCVAFALAAHIAKAITGKDSDLRNMFELANEKILMARVNAANSRNATLESTPSWLAARGYGGAGPFMPYIYPNAEFSVSGFNNLG